MAGIPITQVPQLRQAQFQQTVDPNLLTAPGRAMQQLGGAIMQSGQVAQHIVEKKERHATDGATAKAQLSMIEAQGKLDSYQMQNPDAPEKWEEKRAEYFGAARETLQLDGLGREGVEKINNLYDYSSKVSQIKLGAQIEKRQIELKNADMLQLGKNLLANGDREGALKWMGKMTMPREQKVLMIEETMRAGRYEEILGQIDTAPTLEDAQGIHDGLMERDKDGNFTQYSEDIGAMPYERRTKLINIARNQVKVRKNDALKSVNKAMKAIHEGKDWELGADVSDEKRVAVEQFALSTTDGMTKESTEFTELQKDLTGSQRFLGMGDKDQSWFDENWKKINGGYYNEDGDWVEEGTQFNRQARMALIVDMVKAEADSIADDEEDVERKFFDRDIEPGEKLVRTSLRNRVDMALKAMADKSYSGSVSPDAYGRAYSTIVDQIRQDANAGKMDGDKARGYLENELTALMQEHIKPLDNKRLRDRLRGEDRKAERESEFTVGQRAVQDGTTYEFDGESWNPVK